MLTKNLNFTDLSSLVDLHYEVLPNEFLTSISKSFLLGFYKNLFTSPNTHFIGIFTPNKSNLSNKTNSNLIAAIVGLEKSYKPRIFPRLERGLVAGRSLAFKPSLTSYFLLFLKNSPSFLFKLDKFIQLVQSFVFKLKEKQETEIFFIGVAKGYQGKGIGKKLINALEDELKGKYNDLSVDCKCKLPSNNFYKSCGFKIKKQFNLYGENWNRYEKEIV